MGARASRDTFRCKDAVRVPWFSDFQRSLHVRVCLTCKPLALAYHACAFESANGLSEG
jgi:hypothetical protein